MDRIIKEQARIRAQDAEVARVVTRLSSQLVLRLIAHLSALTEGDNLLSIVMISINTANTSHIDAPPSLDGPYRRVDDVVPDEQKRPISRMAVATMLGLPPETARRYIAKLEKMGACKRVKGGVIVPASFIQSPGSAEHAISAVADVRKFVRALKAAGLDFD